jgi:hypothetical protein
MLTVGEYKSVNVSCANADQAPDADHGQPAGVDLPAQRALGDVQLQGCLLGRQQVIHACAPDDSHTSVRRS